MPDAALTSEPPRTTSRRLWRSPDRQFGTAFGAPVWRFRVFGAVFLPYLGYALVDLPTESRPRQVGSIALLVVFVAFYLGLLPRAAFGGRQRWRVVALAGMVATSALYLVVAGRGGLIFATYLSVAIVTTLRPRASVPVLVVMAAAVTFLPQYVPGWDVQGEQWAIGSPPLLTGVTMLAIQATRRSNEELYLSRQEIERMATEQERLRIARDVHDLLGHALTTVTVKAELAARLVERDPAAARREMVEVAELSRGGLADVRAAVAGYREISLVTELATAREVLRAAGIAAELPASVEQVPRELRELFGWTVREGVTNAVRHSRAQHVRICLQGSGIEVLDDGDGGGHVGPPGNGLTGLIERAAAHGGRVSTERLAPGFRLTVEVPA